MSDRTYYRVSPSIWHPKRRHWTDDMRLLAMYLLTSPHRNTEGLYYLPLGYIETDLDWGSDRVSDTVCDRVSDRVSHRVSNALSQLEAEGFVEYDYEARVVFLVNALRYQPPVGPKQITGAVRALRDIPETPLFQRLHEKAIQYAIGYAKGLAIEYRERLGIPNTIALTPSPSPSPKNPIVGSPTGDPDPPPVQEPEPDPAFHAQAKEVLVLVKARTGIDWRKPHKHLVARLRDGHSVEDCMAVVEFKHSEWKDDPKMAQYLRQPTLYQPSKFEGYLHAAKIWNAAGRKPRGTQDTKPTTPSWVEEYNALG